jgi:hypothetical protein
VQPDEREVRIQKRSKAGMAELADAADSKSADPCGHGGSTPPPGTIYPIYFQWFAGHALTISAFSGTNLGTVHILFTFNRLKASDAYSSQLPYIKLASFMLDYGMRSG